jgi:hypothetical protein
MDFSDKSVIRTAIPYTKNRPFTNTAFLMMQNSMIVIKILLLQATGKQQYSFMPTPGYIFSAMRII